MSLLALIAVLSLLAYSLSLPVFEAVFFSLLFTPLITFLAGSAGVPLAAPLFLACLPGVLVLLALLAGAGNLNFRRPRWSSGEFLPLIIFGCCFLVLHALCLLWPDFISIGERLRDYALLAANINAPLQAREPWLVDYTLNYYLYWYRFGHFMSVTLKLPVWDVYHLLAAFSSSFYFTVCFQLLHRYLSFSLKSALFCAVLITFGSNIAGVVNFLHLDPNWWGPSRVTAGAINEFPAWSFLLGDLHPHFLNLALVPFLLVLSLHLFARKPGGLGAFIWLIAAGSAAPLWIFNSNAWEVPIWLILVAAAVFNAGLACWREFSGLLFSCKPLRLAGEFVAEESSRFKAALAPQRPEAPAATAVEAPSFSPGGLKNGLRALSFHTVFLALLLLATALVSLYLSSRNIQPASYPWTLVLPPVMRTSLGELLRHFGVPVTLLTISLGFRSDWRALLTVLTCLAAAGANAAWPVMALLLMYAMAESLALPFRRAGGELKDLSASIFVQALGLTALALLLVPEVVFLNDPYGGENERMNTIFKIYSACWFMLHVYAFAVTREKFRPIVMRLTNSKAAAFWKSLGYALQLSVLVLFLGFFVQTISLRKSRAPLIQPVTQGLSAIEQNFEGAAAAIQALEKAPAGTVLEAQGKPYSYTSHVSTLAGKEAYLGWANHVDLLVRAYDESRRRTEITEKIYRAADCRERAELMATERIKYLVVGPLEKEKFPDVDTRDFSCLEQLVAAGRYRIFRR